MITILFVITIMFAIIGYRSCYSATPQAELLKLGRQHFQKLNSELGQGDPACKRERWVVPEATSCEGSCH